LPPAAIQTPRMNSHHPPSRQAPRRSGRLTAQKRLEKPGQLKPIICAAKRRKRTQHPPDTPAEKEPVHNRPLDNTRTFKEIVCPVSTGHSAVLRPPVLDPLSES